MTQVDGDTSDRDQHHETPHGRWPRHWWHYPFMPLVLLVRMRPTASAQAWFLWGILSSVAHGVIIVIIFGLADTIPPGVLAVLMKGYPLVAAIITYLQVKSIGGRPPGQENWDKWDNRTSYFPIVSIGFVVVIYATTTMVLHFSTLKPWWGIWEVLANFLPRAWGEIWINFFVAIFLSLSDMSMIDIQYLISRGLSRVTPR